MSRASLGSDAIDGSPSSPPPSVLCRRSDRGGSQKALVGVRPTRDLEETPNDHPFV